MCSRCALKNLPAQQRELDVVQLHKLVLEEILGMSEEDIRAQKHLKYIRDAERSRLTTCAAARPR